VGLYRGRWVPQGGGFFLGKKGGVWARAQGRQMKWRLRICFVCYSARNTEQVGGMCDRPWRMAFETERSGTERGGVETTSASVCYERRKTQRGQIFCERSVIFVVLTLQLKRFSFAIKSKLLVYYLLSIISFWFRVWNRTINAKYKNINGEFHLCYKTWSCSLFTRRFPRGVEEEDEKKLSRIYLD